MTEPRRPLEQHGGPVHATGPVDSRVLLVHALEAAATAAPDTLTHGFHTWTARMHPAIASVVIDGLAPASGAVLDPFGGSGTVALEAFVAGRESLASDLNPLGPLVGRVKTQVRNVDSRHRLEDAIRGVAVRSEERVRARVNAVAPIPRTIAAWFDGHILKELAGLREEIMACTESSDRDAMRVVFSSILVKTSKKRADSSQAEITKSLRKGLATEFFLRKGLELVERYEALEAHVPRGAKQPKFMNADVRALDRLLSRDALFDLVVSSPPYGGTYDYAEHHALRYAFLGLDASALDHDEIGARRFANDEGSIARWDDETFAYLDAMRRRLRPDGNVVLVVGDGRVEGQHIPVIDQLADIAPHAGLELHATASEPRQGFGYEDGPPRAEHLVWLKPTKGASQSARAASSPGNLGKPSKPGAPARPARADAEGPRGTRGGGGPRPGGKPRPAGKAKPKKPHRKG